MSNSSNTLGIYFGPKTVTAVEIKGKKPVNHIHILQSTVSSGELEERVPVEVKGAGLVSLFKNDFQKYRVEAKEAALALSGRDLIVRIFELPVLPHAELQNAIKFEVKKYIPFKTEDLISGFQVKYDRANKINLILFMGIKRETLERYASMLAQLGVKIKNIEYSPFSVLRALSLANIGSHDVVGMLMTDLTGEDEVNFTFLENGFPLFTRDIALTSTREEMFEGASHTNALDKLRTEIHVSLDYFLRRFSEKNIKRVFLISSKEHRQPLEVFMGEIGLSAHYLDVEKQIRQSVPYSLTYLKAYYASLYHSTKNFFTVDLLLEMEKQVIHKEPMEQRALAFFEDLRLDYRAVIIGIVICISTFFYGTRQNDAFSKDLNKAIAKRPSVKGVDPNTSNEELNKLIDQYRKRIEDADRTVKQRVSLTTIINMLPRILPSGTWLKSFSFKKISEFQAELSLDGMAYLGDATKEFEAVNKLAENLKTDSDFRRYFNDVIINNMERQGVEDGMVTHFFLTCRKK
jgi:hypothetical protein